MQEAKDIPSEIQEVFQDIIDILAEITRVPAALIMRINKPYIEVCASSNTENNPYHPGDKEVLEDSGLYCETVIKTQKMLLIPNALEDPEWNNNPDIKLNMISYLGFPITLPDGEPFGTLCILDRKENAYSEVIQRLMLRFTHLIESHLAVFHMNQTLGDSNRLLNDYLNEIQVLRGLVPICANCKSIRDTDGHWLPVEHYLQNPETRFSHGVCPACLEKYYPD